MTSGDNVRDLTVPDEAAMLAWGAALGRAAAGRAAVILLQGDLGMGKTTLSRGVLRGLGYHGAVKSPTYTLVEPYDLDDQHVFHFDLYRLGDPEELEYLGIREYFSGNSLCLVEWPEKARGFLPPADLVVRISPQQQGRYLQLQAGSDVGAAIVAALPESVATG